MKKQEKTSEKNAEPSFRKVGNKPLDIGKLNVSLSEKKCLEYASGKKHKEVLDLMDGYSSCLEKKWIDDQTKELTPDGRKALASAIFSSK